MATSTLNPNAPIFVPASYRTVEDFSDQWWDLVRSSPWFRDYWLRECFSDPQDVPSLPEIDDLLLADVDFLFDNGLSSCIAANKGEDSRKDLVSLGALKWHKTRVPTEVPRYCLKTPKIVNVKVSPRTIQQPR